MHSSELKKLIGFLFFIFGMLTFVLLFIGANFTFLQWLDLWGKGIGLLLRLLMVGLGVIISYFGWLEENQR